MTVSLWPPNHRPPARTDPNLSPERRALLTEAEDFLRLYHAERNSEPVEPRLTEVRMSIAETGYYTHTAGELEFGAKVAWRNSARCIGRLYWNSLRVRDRREVREPAAVAAACVEHLRDAANGGRIRPIITVFAPDRPDLPGPRIHNDQLIRYAGYRTSDGTVVGDPANVALTELATSFGWRPLSPPGSFDVLPLIVQDGGDSVLTELPDDAVLDVDITHPELPAVAGLGLRWYAVPAISNMRLRIGGIDYAAAPFNGWYMGTEIGARNFADTGRYDLLPVFARLFGLDTSAEQHLWRDRALVEINRAVLHSFRAAGVTITDHHTESDRFLTHLEREERAGRRCPADWSWIVPPMSGSATSVFHRYYDTDPQLPNFLPPKFVTESFASGTKTRRRTNDRNRDDTCPYE